MKILKIEDKKGWFINPKKWNKGCEEDKQNYEAIEKISKADIFDILDYFLDEDIEFDEYDADQLPNPLQDIIYEKLYEQLKTVRDSKEDILKGVEEEFEKAKQKYNDF